MPVLTVQTDETETLDFSADVLERFRTTWTRPTTRRPVAPRAEETLACETVIDCTDTEDCETVDICSTYDCTGCDNSCSCVA